ncbi:MAG: hypothetical protein Roseis2KO_01950 [Roseivirga sp.]
MKGFLKKGSIVVLPLILLLTVVNYFGDAAKIFHSDYEKEMVRILNQGFNVTNITNYDERVFQRHFIQSLKEAPDIVVLGSSRTALIGSELLNENSVINNSVSGASIEDLLALYQIYKSNNLLPEKFMIGIDPWMFNMNNGQTKWKSIATEYEEFLNRGNDNLTFLDGLGKYSQLLSLSYFQASLPEVTKNLKGLGLPLASEKRVNESNTKLGDGSLTYSDALQSVSQEQVEKEVDEYLSGAIYGVEDFFEISPAYLEQLKMLLTDMIEEEIEVSLFMAPYHPRVYSILSLDYPLVQETEVIVKNLSRDLRVTHYGSFNPSTDDLKPGDFYDGMHCKIAGIKKILKLK